jgi:lipooligosaccharide transport system permease protein
MALPQVLRYAEREAHMWRLLWHGSLSTGVLTPILFLGAMGIGVGGMVDESTGTVEGVDYLTFVAPGLLVASAVQQVTPTALWSVLGGHKWMGHFRAAVSTPLRPTDVYVGFLAWQGCHAAINAVPFLVVAAVMGGVPSLFAVLAVPVTALCVVACAAPLAAFASSQDRDAAFAAIIRLLVLPLVLFSGVFFPIGDLPVGLRPIAWVTPLWHGVELNRGATTGSISLLAAVGHLAYLVGFLLLAGQWGFRSFNQRLSA